MSHSLCCCSQAAQLREALRLTRDPSLAYFQRESQKINEIENRRISEALTSSDHEIASIAASSGAFTKL